jgi:hypothetical protein
MKKLIGLFASVALMGSGMALAHDKEHKDKQTQSQTGSTQDIGGSGTQTGTGTQVGSGGQQMGQSGQQMGQSGTADQLGGNQLTGRVVKSERKTIWIEHMGAIVPLKIDKNTRFADPSIKRASDLKEGDQVRASFEVRKTDNVATSIEMSSGMGPGQGGSGSDVLTPDQGINPPLDNNLPPSSPDGTGGSGNDLEGDITEGTSPDSSLDTGDKAGDY